MTAAVDEAQADGAASASRRGAVAAGGFMAATGVLLAGAYFPLMFSRWQTYDDEGLFLVSLRQLLRQHQHLYTGVWADKYGPFYYMVMTTLYRVIHLQPTLENGRWIVLILTTMSAALFGGAVWRVTKNLPCSILCEVAAFLVLINGAGNEPMHPGSLAVFLLAAVAFEVSSYAASRRNVHLLAVGALAGALAMTKLNVGGFVIVAVAAGLIVGNRDAPRWLRIAVAAAAAFVPVALLVHAASTTWVAELGFLVIGTLAAVGGVMCIDELSLPRLPVVGAAACAAAVGIASLAFPLVTGTPLSAVLTAVFVRPLNQANELSSLPTINVSWLMVVLTAGGIYAAAAFRSSDNESARAQSTWTNLTLAAVGLWLLGVGGTIAARGAIAEWLPAIAVLPAIAFCANSPESVRLALRCLVLLAVFQILGVYPVVGTQLLWGTVAMTVPCAIAIAAGLDATKVWRESSHSARFIVTAVLCLGLVTGSTLWPIEIWSAYMKSPKLDLPGTGLMRLDPTLVGELQQTTRVLDSECDTFYGVPEENSFYVFTGISPPTGMIADRPVGLTDAQQRQIVAALQARTKANQRVCILRDNLQPAAPLLPGPLNTALADYTNIIATAGNYTISRRN